MINLQKYPTVLGYAALFFWAAAAPFAALLKNLPVFEILSIVFIVSFILSSIKLTLWSQWNKLRQPWFLWIIGIVGVYGNDILYIAAFQHAPAAHADLINYLWPIFVILFGCLLPGEKFSFPLLFAAFVSFLGIYLLLQDSQFEFKSDYFLGYLFAFLDALVWSTYTLMARHYNQLSVEVVGVYCGVAAVCSLFTHIGFETFLMPQGSQWLILFIMGCTTQCLAYFFWDFGIKQGDFKLLSILSYGNPIISILLLIAFGLTEPSTRLFIAAALVSCGGFIGMLGCRVKREEIQ